jgi:hypothetical protein
MPPKANVKAWEPTEAPDAELMKLFLDTGIDLSVLPPVCTAAELAPVIRTSEAALAQDRYRKRGIPYITTGSKRIRYLRVDVARFLIANRQEVSA